MITRSALPLLNTSQQSHQGYKEHIVPETANTPILSVDNLSVEFDGQRVIEDLSFTVEAGKTLAIVGESGSGKSTIANALP